MRILAIVELTILSPPIFLVIRIHLRSSSATERTLSECFGVSLVKNLTDELILMISVLGRIQLLGASNQLL